MANSALTLPDRMTVQEFLAWDDGTDTRYELVGGRPVAMAAPSPVHSRITGNIAGVLFGRVRPPCRVHTEHGVALADHDDEHYQVDVAVVCGDVRRGEPPPNPILVAEVLSPSTENHDRYHKAPRYRVFVPGLQIILLVRTDRRWVERWARDGDRWIVTDHIGERGEVALDALGTGIDLAEVYEATDVG